MYIEQLLRTCRKANIVKNKDILSRGKQIRNLCGDVSLSGEEWERWWMEGGKSKVVGGIQMGQRERLQEKDRGKLFISVAGKKLLSLAQCQSLSRVAFKGIYH